MNKKLTEVSCILLGQNPFIGVYVVITDKGLDRWRPWSFKHPMYSTAGSSDATQHHPVMSYVHCFLIESHYHEKSWALSYHHHQIENMNRWPLFRIRPWDNDMRSISCYVLMYYYVSCASVSLDAYPSSNPLSQYSITDGIRIGHQLWLNLLLMNAIIYDKPRQIKTWVSANTTHLGWARLLLSVITFRPPHI